MLLNLFGTPNILPTGSRMVLLVQCPLAPLTSGQYVLQWRVGSSLTNAEARVAHVHPLEPDEWSRSMLACNGFTREVLSLLDSNPFALSLQVFHLCLFQTLPNNIRLAHIFDGDTSSAHTQFTAY